MVVTAASLALALLVVTAPRSAAAAGEAATPLSSSHTSLACAHQAELRELARARCTKQGMLLTNVKYTDLCGADGAEAMYATIIFDCHAR